MGRKILLVAKLNLLHCKINGLLLVLLQADVVNIYPRQLYGDLIVLVVFLLPFF